MAILNLQRKKDAPETKKIVQAPKDETSKPRRPRFESVVVLKNPRITEKVSRLMELDTYTFDVLFSATKQEVKNAVFARYNVMPVRVNMLRVKSKRKFTRGKLGRTARGKKALVQLKKGDKIDIL
ncbi:MAG: large subunit ribosomal protein L23 [Parcubacteria group bacterium Greene1014_15]|nr:MAG: large subunit ribosomal protein L23 [Parcubacteria group bacterium Greene1014_15]